MVTGLPDWQKFLVSTIEISHRAIADIKRHNLSANGALDAACRALVQRCPWGAHVGPTTLPHRACPLTSDTIRVVEEGRSRVC